MLPQILHNIKEYSGLHPDRSCDVPEVGCGIGGGISVFAEAGCNVVGADIQAPSIE